MKVFVTPRAEKNFDSIVSYIHSTWGENSAKEFIQKTDDIFELLMRFPQIGQIELGDIRGFQLSPQTRILYRINDNRIIILAFFDGRQHPKKKFK